MKINSFSLLFVLSVIGSQALAQTYVVPPTERSNSRVPVISDEAMEQCVKDYNKSVWLEQDIKRTMVDQYSQSSIDSYNSKVSRLNKMTDAFNRNCAGKQSASAARAAERLNNSKK